ncbi:hypothetical protein HYPGJ_20906 [Hyphomicrobium sp. GJ21]|nr:hypothetical protein HYPGJ_20906 [Hyphomicrobium sp. GJ21]
MAVPRRSPTISSRCSASTDRHDDEHKQKPFRATNVRPGRLYVFKLPVPQVTDVPRTPALTNALAKKTPPALLPQPSIS